VAGIQIAPELGHRLPEAPVVRVVRAVCGRAALARSSGASRAARSPNPLERVEVGARDSFSAAPPQVEDRGV
jgi:hypothetical protein